MTNSFHKKQEPIQTLRLSFGVIKGIPDPANITSASQWYLINHIASTLITYRQEDGQIVPILAESWSNNGNVYTFKLKSDLKFQDGKSITAYDVEASIKRVAILKKATHFPLWEYLVGCENLKDLRSKCDGIHVLDLRTIQFTLKEQNDSFVLQMMCPEGSIWSKDDIDPVTSSLNPKSFSGPYWISKVGYSGFLLRRNSNSVIQRDFPNSPDEIELETVPLGQLESQFLKQKLDIFMSPEFPDQEVNPQLKEIKRFYSTPSVVTYLRRVHPEQAGSIINQKFIAMAWDSISDQSTFPAETFLPFGSFKNIERNVFLDALSKSGSDKIIKIAALDSIHSEKLAKKLEEVGKKASLNVQVERVPINDWVNLMDTKKSKESPFDFVMGAYVGSDRYPSVQLRYILGDRAGSFGELSFLDNREQTKEVSDKLIALEQKLLKNQTIVPLFFTRMAIYYQNHLNIGNQPKTDADIQLWRVTHAE